MKNYKVPSGPGKQSQIFYETWKMVQKLNPGQLLTGPGDQIDRDKDWERTHTRNNH